MNSKILALILFALLAVPFGIYAEEDATQKEASTETQIRELKAIFPQTCVTPGLAHELAKKFEAEYHTPVKVISQCTGDAIAMVKKHEGTEVYDIMIGHEPDEEAQFIKEGFAVNLRQICYSDFVLVGPAEDPAKIKGIKDVLKALKKIASTKSTFISRADLSGTHGLEMRLWKMAKIKPSGDWYLETHVGTPEALTIAAKKKGYFISHWATFAEMQETIDLVPLIDDTANLFTNYDAMAINPERFPTANYVTAMQFIGFLTSPETQKFIHDFGIEKYHRPSFIPLAVKPTIKKKEVQ